MATLVIAVWMLGSAVSAMLCLLLVSEMGWAQVVAEFEREEMDPEARRDAAKWVMASMLLLVGLWPVVGVVLAAKKALVSLLRARR